MTGLGETVGRHMSCILTDGGHKPRRVSDETWRCTNCGAEWEHGAEIAVGGPLPRSFDTETGELGGTR